jgi:hypothetical protein
MCLDCTIFGPSGFVLPDFKLQLFHLATIQRYITRGKTNVLICEFEYEAEALTASAAAPTMSQLSQYSNESLNMGGHPFPDPFNLRFGMPPKNESVPMGYLLCLSKWLWNYGTGNETII